MNKILISACLLGQRVRYDGGDKLLQDPHLQAWSKQGRLVPLCPEVAGGLPTPRPAAEIVGNKMIVQDVNGYDVTRQFQRGAASALALCQTQDIRYAILTEASPSCGSSTRYDGTFTGNKIPGMGITTQLLTAHDIQVFSQFEIAKLAGLFDQESLPAKA